MALETMIATATIARIHARLDSSWSSGRIANRSIASAIDTTATTATTSPTTNGTCQAAAADTAIMPASIDRSPCAKLTTCRAWYTTLIASAISAYTLPMARPAIRTAARSTGSLRCGATVYGIVGSRRRMKLSMSMM